MSRLRWARLGCFGRCVCPRFMQQHRCLSSKASRSLDYDPGMILRIPDPQLDIKRYCDPSLTDQFVANIVSRKGVGNIHRVIELNRNLGTRRNEEIRRELIQEALRIPNDTHPEPAKYGKDPKVLRLFGSPPKYHFKPKSFEKLVENTDHYRMKELSPLAGHKAYYFCRGLAELEQALIRFTIQTLLKRGFSLISVPDILHHQIIECCGMSTRGKRNIVYRLDADKHLASAAEGELCLSGTAEMALGGFLMNKILPAEELPKRYVAVSRCYRAETADVSSEKGLYRVHQFTKVEMFGASKPDQSEDLLEEFQSIQEEIFSSFDFHMQVLDMPPHELGSPAYRKYDIEVWLPSRQGFGEVSSCSNCTDYQSRRLNIQYSSGKSDEKVFAHTVNGTACAIPRLIMAICEIYQQEDGSIQVPLVLQPFMSKKEIRPLPRVTRFWKRAKDLLEKVDVE